MIMAYKILYIDDVDAESREKDLQNLGFDVLRYKPTSNLQDFLDKVDVDTNASVLDYRLTEGEGVNRACFDAPTLAQTLRTKHKNDAEGFPLVLMSNEKIKVEEFDKDLTSQDLFDFVLTKEDFLNDMASFSQKLNSFIGAYKTVKENKFDLEKILGISPDSDKLHSRLISKKEEIGRNVFKLSCFIYYDIVRPIGLLIGEDVLSARLGVDKKSSDWGKLKEQLRACIYKGVFSDYLIRWWMNDINKWWDDSISETSLRRLNANERVELLKEKLSLNELIALKPSQYSESSNFWTICKESKIALDPFDGVELLRDYEPWQEKEYISIDSALINMDDYKLIVSEVDKKAIREIVKKERENE